MNHRLLILLIALSMSLLAGCGDSDSADPSDTDDGSSVDVTDTPSDLPSDATDQLDTLDAGDSDDDMVADVVSIDLSPLGLPDRPAQVTVPRGWDQSEPLPIIVSLHGYAADAFIQDAYLGISDQINDKRFILLEPQGEFDDQGKRRWNQDDPAGVDDVGYLSAIIGEAQMRYNDDGRVFLIGHSNGGYMSYRMACERADILTGILPLAGLEPSSFGPCEPARPLSILHVHGTIDPDVPYAGYPMRGIESVDDLMVTWVGRLGCDATANGLPAKDLELTLPGAETEVEHWGNCDAGAEIELWRIVDAGHTPVFDRDVFTSDAIDWLLAHPVQ